MNALNKNDADDEPISILTILNSNGIRDAVWCFRADWFEETPRYMEFLNKTVSRVNKRFEYGEYVVKYANSASNSINACARARAAACACACAAANDCYDTPKQEMEFQKKDLIELFS